MSVFAEIYASAKVGTTPLPVRECQVTLDAGWAPYAQASLVIPYDPATDALIDPRDDVRVVVLAEQGIGDGSGGSLIPFDLGVRSREINHNDATTTLTLASDEALLQDWLLLDDEPDLSAAAYRTSLRSIINNVILNRIGAHLEAGTPDASFEFVYDSTNLVTNPKAGTATTGWSQSIAGTAPTAVLSRITGAGGGLPAEITTRVRLTVSALTGAGTSFDLRPDAAGMPVSAGKTYRASAYIRSSIAGDARTFIQWFDNTSTQISTTSSGLTAIGAAAAFVRIDLAGTAPAGATSARLVFRVQAAVVAGSWMELSGVLLQESMYLENYFDGATAANAEVSYAWAGTADASASKRTALVNRAADLLRLDPGESLYAFLEPLLTAAGLRLFCDENRLWRLVNVAYVDTSWPLVTVAAGYNAITGTDIIDRDDDESWAEGVIVKYTWRDSTGLEHVGYDIAGSGSKALLVEYDRPHPGPGAAAYILSRMTGKGRVQDVEALVNMSVRPSQETAITLPDTDVQVGQVQAVSWDFTQATMRLKSRGLTDAPTTSWALDTPGVAWQDLAVGIDWTEDI